MTGFNHVLAGTIVAIAVKDPLFIIPTAFASHFLMDSLPHFGNHPSFLPYNKLFVRYITFDALVCIVVLATAIILSPQDWFILFLGAGFAILPDFAWPYIKSAPAWLQWFYTFHKRIQWAEVPYGWKYEIGYFITGSALYIALSLN